MRDYQIVSPSLEGVVSDACVHYGGFERPLEVLRILDGPAAKGFEIYEEKSDRLSGKPKLKDKDKKILENYYQDLCSIFMKKVSAFMVEDRDASEEGIRLLAILQEIIKVKKLRADL